MALTCLALLTNLPNARARALSRLSVYFRTRHKAATSVLSEREDGRLSWPRDMCLSCPTEVVYTQNGPDGAFYTSRKVGTGAVAYLLREGRAGPHGLLVKAHIWEEVGQR